MAILDKWTLDFISSSMEQTVRLGVRLGELLQPYDVLCLSVRLSQEKQVYGFELVRVDELELDLFAQVGVHLVHVLAQM